MNAIEKTLLEIIAEIKRIDLGELNLEYKQDFINDLEIDSLDAVNITVEIGERFGFSFGEEIDDLDALSSFGSLIALIERRATIDVSSSLPDETQETKSDNN